jgi:hypothetical protein
VLVWLLLSRRKRPNPHNMSKTAPNPRRRLCQGVSPEVDGFSFSMELLAKIPRAQRNKLRTGCTTDSINFAGVVPATTKVAGLATSYFRF